MANRRRFKQIEPFQDRLAEWAKGVLAQAGGMPPGPERDELVRKARHADTAAHLDAWANSPGLQPPK